MRAYVINLDSAKERWAFVQTSLAGCGLDIERVQAVDGGTLQRPIPDCSEWRYRLWHGKTVNVREVGCYLSHLKAIRCFHQSQERFAMICEDDIRPDPHLAEVLAQALDHTATWDILRLSGLNRGTPVPYASLAHGYRLCIHLSRVGGAGAYVLNRRAAGTLLSRLPPMRVPLDHALDREWFYRLRASSVFPFPVSQRNHSLASQIMASRAYKLPAWQRYWTVFPYRAYNEIGRGLTRTARAIYLCARPSRTAVARAV